MACSGTTLPFFTGLRDIHVKWVACHHGMARPRVADGGEGLQVWRVAANILNKQSRTADKGWSSSLGIGRGLTTPHRKTRNTLRNVTKGIGIGQNRWKNYFRHLLNVHGVNDVRQTEIHTAEPLVPEPSSSEVEIAIEKL
jgi:hypothetical protein